MPKAFTPKVVTANHLLEGDVIYLANDGGWTRRLEEAEVLMDEDYAAVRLGEVESRQSEVVGPYLADVTVGPKGVQTTHFREEFRKTGPSNYNHGKQAEAV
ncbi:DUF2849 domain-containing protein [Pseudoprimorskyibacter insulae]|uniref:Uncharacterized protein n=1 Tax=Pseudoprimorskyibacter insulae TaxID=1695997 RepID=A0A2R8AWR2_9RHOB|nr:DUF2849 domain-containing protein [Pseudoprimorskyibacter insulae]SPF80481.1 hypothetical protein PRI8871_02291 [Pseudoprimorskyibacter insulae]